MSRLRFSGKTIVVLILAVMICCVSYVFAIDEYDEMSTDIEWLSNNIKVHDIAFTEIGIEMNTVAYNEKLNKDDIISKRADLVHNLSHLTTCTKLCKLDHRNDIKLGKVKEHDDCISTSLEEKGYDWSYVATIRNQKDVNYNTYYDIKVKGATNVDQLDCIVNWANEYFKAMDITPLETVYFKGTLPKKLTQRECEKIKKTMFKKLDGKTTNFYQDELNSTTCAYYGYTPHYKGFIKEADGAKSNVQLAFSYDDVKGCTNVIVAFPFYNEPF